MPLTRRIRYRLLALFVAMLAAIGPSHSAQGGTEPIVVGVEAQSYLPVFGVNGTEYVGYARELLDAFARDKGLTLEYRPLPVPRLYAAFLAGQVDLKFPDHPNWQADRRTGKQIVYSDSLAAFVDGVSVPRGNAGRGIAALRTLGTVSGFTPWAMHDQIKAGKVSVSENPSIEGLLRQVIGGRHHGVYASVAVVNYQLDKVWKQPGALVFDPTLPYSRDHYYASSIKRPDVIRELSAWLKQNQKFVDELKARHAVEKGFPAP
jgi:polar amino acid transport system substrate-binding protein